MKHLKTFENLIDDFKKYIIIPSGPNHLYILEKIGIDTNVLVTKHIYTYNKKLNKIISIDKSSPEYSDYSNEFRLPLIISNKIIYQSDNLDDIFEKIELLSNTNKYNL